MTVDKNIVEDRVQLKVGAQPPVPYVRPFAAAAEEMGVIELPYLETFISLIKESGMEVTSIMCKRWASYHVESGPHPLTLVADWDDRLAGNDVVFIITEKA